MRLTHQDIIDTMSYEYCSQVDIENTLVRSGKAILDFHGKIFTNAMIDKVYNLLSDLLKDGIIEREQNFDNGKLNRRYNMYKLTGESCKYLVIPPKHLPIPENQLLLFQ